MGKDDGTDNDNGTDGAAGSTSTQEDNVDTTLKNMKSEFSRKIENLSSSLAQQNQQMEALLGRMQQQVAPPEASEDIANLIYSDPASAVNKIVERVTKQVETKHQQTSTAQQTVVKLQGEYPELGDMRTTAYKAAERYYDQLPATLKGTAEGAEIALMRAVREEGLMPKGKRDQQRTDGEDFSLDGEGARRNVEPKGARGKKSEIDPRTLGFAELMGKNVKDPKYIERLKKESTRESWNKWQTVEGEE